MVVLSSFPRPTEGIRLEHQNTEAFHGRVELGKGTLYIAESKLSWIRGDEYGFSIDYPHITLHAISRDRNAFPVDCLFLILDIKLEVSQTEMEYDPEEAITELRFVPEDRGLLDAMFHALSACQALHPDPEDSYSDEDMYDNYAGDYADDSICSQLNNLCIAGNNVYGAVLNNTAESRVDAEGRMHCRTLKEEEDMMSGTCPDTASTDPNFPPACTQPSSPRTSPACYHTEKSYKWTDIGRFDDAEN